MVTLTRCSWHKRRAPDFWHSGDTIDLSYGAPGTWRLPTLGHHNWSIIKYLNCLFKVLSDYQQYFRLHIIHVFVLSGCKSPVFPIFQPSYYWARRIARLMTNLDKTFTGGWVLTENRIFMKFSPAYDNENIPQCCANIILRHDQKYCTAQTTKVAR